MKNMITKEQYDIMLPFERHFYTAVNGAYARNVTMEGLRTLDNVYREVFGRDGGLVNGCSRCRLNGLRDLGNKFYEYKQALEELENKEESIDNKALPKKRATKKPRNK